MKKHLFILVILCIAFFGCSPAGQKKEIVARINDYEITKDKFETEFKESIYGRTDTFESRKEFLDNLINRKLILQDAQQQGLDKQKGFLRAIERFWEQSLLKIALDKKTQEIAGSISVSDAEIRQSYDRMFEQGKIDMPYEQVREKLKKQILNLKEQQAINEWVAQLNKEARIKINEDLLKRK